MTALYCTPLRNGQQFTLAWCYMAKMPSLQCWFGLVTNTESGHKAWLATWQLDHTFSEGILLDATGAYNCTRSFSYILVLSHILSFLIILTSSACSMSTFGICSLCVCVCEYVFSSVYVFMNIIFVCLYVFLLVALSQHAYCV